MSTQSQTPKSENEGVSITLAHWENLGRGIALPAQASQTPARFKVFTAVNRDLEPGDFNWCEEGEMLVTHFVCDRKDCGCERSHSGINSLKSTTVMRVEERMLTPSGIMALIEDYSKRSGWSFDIAAPALTDAMISAMQFDVGEILRTQYDDFDGTWSYTRIE